MRCIRLRLGDALRAALQLCSARLSVSLAVLLCATPRVNAHQAGVDRLAQVSQEPLGAASLPASNLHPIQCLCGSAARNQCTQLWSA